MDRYVCEICGYVYDPSEGDLDNDIKPDILFEELPEDWTCPECHTPKEDFIIED